jgi:putative lipoic acid-binding regulatory protein
MADAAAPRPSLLEFTCDFPVKIMGAHTSGFAQAMLEIVQRHAPGFDPTAMQTRASRKGNYLSLTCTFRARSQQQIDALYRELSMHPMVKVVL